MPSLDYIKENYALTEHGTGGNCTALFHELNTNQDHILIATECQMPTEEYAQEMSICLFLNGEFGEPAFTFDVDNLDQLDEKLHHIYELWGY